jgi:hypothetical protein
VTSFVDAEHVQLVVQTRHARVVTIWLIDRLLVWIRAEVSDLRFIRLVLVNREVSDGCPRPWSKLYEVLKVACWIECVLCWHLDEVWARQRGIVPPSLLYTTKAWVVADRLVVLGVVESDVLQTVLVVVVAEDIGRRIRYKIVDLAIFEADLF